MRTPGVKQASELLLGICISELLHKNDFGGILTPWKLPIKRENSAFNVQKSRIHGYTYS